MELRHRSSAVIETAAMTVEERLGALIGAFNATNRDIWDEVSNHSEIIHRIALRSNIQDDILSDHSADISELFDITKGLTKKLKGKASKFGLALAVIGGIVYIVKNEKDKDNMRTKLLELDKQERSCYCSIKEDEGEALDGEGPLGI